MPAKLSRITRKSSSEGWTAGAFANRQDIGSSRLQPVVYLHVTALIHLHTRGVQADPRSVGHTPGRHQNVTACDCLFARRRSRHEVDTGSGAAVHTDRLGRCDDVDSLAGKYFEERGRDVRALVAKQLGALLNDRHPAAKTTIGLS